MSLRSRAFPHWTLWQSLLFIRFLFLRLLKSVVFISDMRSFFEGRGGYAFWFLVVFSKLCVDYCLFNIVISQQGNIHNLKDKEISKTCQWWFTEKNKWPISTWRTVIFSKKNFPSLHLMRDDTRKKSWYLTSRQTQIFVTISWVSPVFVLSYPVPPSGGIIFV